jgi:Domain of unknown function (DUF5624)
MTYNPHPAFQRLFNAYTSDPASIGMQLTRLQGRKNATDPLLVCTGSDVVLFPGPHESARVESFRRTTRGFIELAAISHLPLAVGWLMRMREIDPIDTTWRESAQSLMQTIQDVQAINTLALWRDEVVVEAWRGLEIRIVDLVTYSCALTSALLERLQRGESISFEQLRQEYLDAPRSRRMPVSMNEMMFATFALTFLDIGFRITRWLRSQAFAWDRLMVLISGRSGRPTAGLTWETNNLCYLIQKASRDRFPRERLYIAPHAPAIDVAAASDPTRAADLESQFRALWFNVRAGIEMGAKLFGADSSAPQGSSAVASNEEASPGFARSQLVAQLRLVLEDPRQLLSNVAANYVIDQLAASDNDPSRVFIPGFSDIDYAVAADGHRNQ